MRYAAVLFRPTERLPGWSGGTYNPGYADKWARSIKRHAPPDARTVIVTDYDAKDFASVDEVLPFVHPERGWASLMEMFRPEVVGEHAILLGLDTICVGSLSLIERVAKDTNYIVPLDPYHKPDICNGVVGVSTMGAKTIWDTWQRRRSQDLRHPRYGLFGAFSEMKWLRTHTEPDATWDSECPGAVCSYKVDLRRGEPTSATRIVYFHGSPKPHELTDAWATDNWR